MKTYTATAWPWWNLLTVTGTVEGPFLHITRQYGGQVQHRFLRADVHAATPDDLRIAVHADLDWMKGQL